MRSPKEQSGCGVMYSYVRSICTHGYVRILHGLSIHPHTLRAVSREESTLHVIWEGRSRRRRYSRNKTSPYNKKTGERVVPSFPSSAVMSGKSLENLGFDSLCITQRGSPNHLPPPTISFLLARSSARECLKNGCAGGKDILIPCCYCHHATNRRGGKSEEGAENLAPATTTSPLLLLPSNISPPSLGCWLSPPPSSPFAISVKVLSFASRLLRRLPPLPPLPRRPLSPSFSFGRDRKERDEEEEEEEEKEEDEKTPS